MQYNIQDYRYVTGTGHECIKKTLNFSQNHNIHSCTTLQHTTGTENRQINLINALMLEACAQSHIP